MVIFDIMKYIGNLTEIQDLHNTHFSFVSGDEGFWEDYASSPIFPVQEQPESDNFYMLYNFDETHPDNTWWHVDAFLAIYIASNDIKLIASMSDALRKELGDYEYARRRMIDADPNLSALNWIRFVESDMIRSQEQENGVKGRLLTFKLNYTDC